MAEEEKKDNNKPNDSTEEKSSKKSESKGISPVTVLIIIASAPLLVYALTNNNLNTGNVVIKENKTQEIVYIQEGANVYKTLNDALCETNGTASYYDTSQQRFVLSTFYEYNGEYTRINMADEDYINNTTVILENGGTIACYLTSIDGINPEGFYPANCVILNNQNETSNSEELGRKQK